MAANQHMTTAEFRCVFPEFASIKDPQLNAILDATRQRVDSSVLVSKTNEAHGQLTAHMLASAPGGQGARLTSEEAMTTYIRNYKAIIKQTVVGLNVSGGVGRI